MTWFRRDSIAKVISELSAWSERLTRPALTRAAGSRPSTSSAKMVAVRLFTVGCFTELPFTGNPTAVCLPDSGWPATGWLQSVAGELNFPATVFVGHGQQGMQLRWFSPKAEFDLCGSGTLAAAHVDSAQTIRMLTPDLTTLATLDARGVIVTAKGDSESDFVSRFFAPGGGHRRRSRHRVGSLHPRCLLVEEAR